MGPEGVTTRVSELAGAMRAAGARVGVGEVLAAHRALAAVDPADRDDAFYALRAAMCSTRAELDLFAQAFALVFMTPGDPLDDPLGELGQIERPAAPRSSNACAPTSIPSPSGAMSIRAWRSLRRARSTRPCLRPPDWTGLAAPMSARRSSPAKCFRHRARVRSVSNAARMTP